MATRSDSARLDGDVRQHIYRTAVGTGAPPTAAEVARTFDLPEADVAAAYERLAAARAIVLRPGTRDIIMAPPFSAVPTRYLVEVAGRAYWGNCIWDALGIPAMLDAEGAITASCGDCDAPMRLAIRARELTGSGVVHFAVPARRWWEDVVYT
jgi:hypothetical protein